MTDATHAHEPHATGVSQKLNWLRAGVLGANDGIVSVASLVVGVAGATTDTPALLLAGVAGLVGGAISMALGEYVSVSSQRDSERALIAKERRELAEITGVVPSLWELGSGCAFRERCPSAHARCAQDVPPMFDAPLPGQPGHAAACWLLAEAAVSKAEEAAA